MILHDNEGQEGWTGELHSHLLENLLRHFDFSVIRKPLADYQAGDLEQHRATFYIGSVWNETPLSAAFETDLKNTTQTFVWLGCNLWRYATDLTTYEPRQDFEDRYGFRLLEHSFENHNRVLYKGQYLAKDAFDPSLARLEVIDAENVRVQGECYTSSDSAYPYIVQSGNFWVVPDNPLVASGFRNRSLVFADMLHEILDVTVPERHRAVLRIEDVSPKADLEDLQALRAVLTELKIPFVISLVPEYRDWTGIYNNSTPEVVKLEPGTPFVEEIKRFVEIGGQIIQHGTTHQIDGLINPYDGVTASDYEFYRMTTDADGNLVYGGPLPEQTWEAVRRRILDGHRRIKSAGLLPVGWLTPHYLASATAYLQFSRLYPLALDRGIFFAEDSLGATKSSELNSPFVYRDTYGIKRIPETIGYIDQQGWAPKGVLLQPPSFPPDLIERARALKVVRDSWAGCYFHWYLNPAYLKELVNGIKGLGFEFVPVTGDLK